MRLALAQINSVVGDLDGNRDRILARLGEARAAGADLVLFPELALTGYPPEDLLLRPGFIRAAARAARGARRRDRRHRRAGRARPTSTATSTTRCFVLADGEVRGVYRKRFLPNYGVFDENRYFAPGARAAAAALRRGARRARRSARTSGSRGRRRPSSPSRARSCSSTSRPRPSTSARAASARR